MSPAWRDRGIAFGLGILAPGLGHLHARRPARGFVWALVFCFVFVPVIVEVPILLASSLPVTLAGYAIGCLFLLAGPVDGALLVPDRPRHPPVGARQWVTHAVCATVLFGIAMTSLVPHLPFHRFRIPSASMMPTLLTGDTIGADMRPPRLASLHVGDLVILESPDDGVLVVKRVAGLPGDFVEVRAGLLVHNGELLVAETDQERYGDRTESLAGRSWEIHLTPQAPTDWPRTEVPEGTCFVLGDNRYSSRDSRVYGSVPEASLRGRPRGIHWSSDPKSGRTRWDRIGRTAQPAPVH